MANLMFNVAKGRSTELFNRVNANDPANAVLVWVPINTATADATLIDLDTLDAVLGDGGTSELTAGGWARVVLTDADVAAISTMLDDANDRYNLDLADVDFGAIAAANDSTDLLLCYDSDSTAGDDTNVVPIAIYDFAVTTDGNNVTAQVNAGGAIQAT